MIDSIHSKLTKTLPAVMVAAVALCSCHNTTDKPAVTKTVPPRNAQARYDGIDISSHQGIIDWAKVSSDKDIRFV